MAPRAARPRGRPPPPHHLQEAHARLTLSVLLLKLALAPALVAAATRVARRLGHGAGGLVGGLPVVAAPILLIFAVEHGEAFAQEAARATVLGIVSLIAFCAVYGAAAARAAWPVAVLAGWAAFGVATAAFSLVELPVAASASLAVGAIMLLVPHLRRAGLRGRLPDAARSDLLLLRLAVTALLVLALTTAAGSLSPRLSGLLAPFPIITAVLAGFTHARAGAAAANELLAGLTTGLVSFVAFFVVLAGLLAPLGVAAAFGAATAVALAGHAVLIATR